MKKLVKTAAVLLAAAGLAGCGAAAEPSQPVSQPVQEASGEDYGIANLPLGMFLTVLQVQEGTVTLQVDNQSGYEMTYTMDFSLEKETDGQWQTVPLREGAAVEDTVVTIADLEKQEVELNLTELYGEPEPGHYRLVQEDMAAEFDME